MDSKELILGLYKRGHSVSFIAQCIYKTLNKDYFYDFYNKKIINSSKYHKIDFCRELVESTILEHISKQRA